MPTQQMLLGAGAAAEDRGTEDIITSGHADYTWVSDTTTWVCPAGVTSISVVCIGAGSMFGNNGSGAGGGGGGLGFKNNITVSPGTSYSVQVGHKWEKTNHLTNENPNDTWFKDANGNIIVSGEAGAGLTGGGYTGDGGGNGGSGGVTRSSWGYLSKGAGAGAGGYGLYTEGVSQQNGNGGNGGEGSQSSSQGVDGSNGQNNGAGGGSSMNYVNNHSDCNTSGGGGGSHLYGTAGGATPTVAGTGTCSGNGGSNDGQQGGNGQCGRDGSGGQYGSANDRSTMDPSNNNDFYTNYNNAYGGGHGGVASQGSCSQTITGSGGAIRIIWPGNTRKFPHNALPVSN